MLNGWQHAAGSVITYYLKLFFLFLYKYLPWIAKIYWIKQLSYILPIILWMEIKKKCLLIVNYLFTNTLYILFLKKWKTPVNIKVGTQNKILWRKMLSFWQEVNLCSCQCCFGKIYLLSDGSSAEDSFMLTRTKMAGTFAR